MRRDELLRGDLLSKLLLAGSVVAVLVAVVMVVVATLARAATLQYISPTALVGVAPRSPFLLVLDTGERVAISSNSIYGTRLGCLVILESFSFDVLIR